jgi:hypothetical protein
MHSCYNFYITILTKPRWGKCDHDIYKDCIQNEINNLEKEHQPVNFKIKQLDQMLHKAGAKAIPKYLFSYYFSMAN